MDTINLIVSKNIRRIRQEKDLSLDEMSKLSGVSKSMLAIQYFGCPAALAL
mgnify:CR=1 FL=1